MDVIVVGAGISGLACAYYLKKHGIDVLVLEKDDRVGGRVKTDVVDGFLMDIGAQFISDSYPIIMELVDELKLKNELCELKSSCAIVYKSKIKKINILNLVNLLGFREFIRLCLNTIRLKKSELTEFDSYDAEGWVLSMIGKNALK